MLAGYTPRSSRWDTGSSRPHRRPRESHRRPARAGHRVHEYTARSEREFPRDSLQSLAPLFSPDSVPRRAPRRRARRGRAAGYDSFSETDSDSASPASRQPGREHGRRKRHDAARGVVGDTYASPVGTRSTQRAPDTPADFLPTSLLSPALVEANEAAEDAAHRRNTQRLQKLKDDCACVLHCAPGGLCGCTLTCPGVPFLSCMQCPSLRSVHDVCECSIANTIKTPAIHTLPQKPSFEALQTLAPVLAPVLALLQLSPWRGTSSPYLRSRHA